jgi:hypothetical protein
MEKTQGMIDFFTSDFASSAIPRFKEIFAGTENASRPASYTEQERDRLYRAFYSFELYSRTFARKALDYAIGGFEMVPQTQVDEVLEQILGLFFRPWSPWANEQLACVFQYLDEKVAVG